MRSRSSAELTLISLVIYIEHAGFKGYPKIVGVIFLIIRSGTRSVEPEGLLSNIM